MRVVWRAEALQELFFSPLGAGCARAEWRNKDSWGDVVSPNPSLRKVSYLVRVQVISAVALV